MNVEDLLDQIEEMVDKSWSLGGKHFVDSDKVKSIIEDIRMNMPDEVRQAKAIASDRVRIMEEAKKEAAAIKQKAEDQARMMTSKDEIVKNAQSIANDILSQAQAKSLEVRRAATEFVDNLMKQGEDDLAKCQSETKNLSKHVEESMSSSLSELKKARVALKSQK